MSFICKIFGHYVETVKTNSWQIPTVERCCRCKLSRSVERLGDTQKFYWAYSDGRNSEAVPMMQEQDIEFDKLK